MRQIKKAPYFLWVPRQFWATAHMKHAPRLAAYAHIIVHDFIGLLSSQKCVAFSECSRMRLAKRRERLIMKHLENCEFSQAPPRQ